MEANFVIHNGIEVAADWPQKIVQAQLQRTYEIDGKLIARVPFGNEADDWGANRGPCHDCGVTRGQLHVPGCDVERCPQCGGQVITCGCDYQGDEQESE